MPKMTDEPRIEVHLRAERICYLSREPRFSLVLFLTLHSETPITLLKGGYGLSAGTSQSINSGSVIECFDTIPGQRLQVFGNQQRCETQSDVPDPAHTSLMTLHLNRTEYTTFTTSTSLRDCELFFSPGKLRPTQ